MSRWWPFWMERSRRPLSEGLHQGVHPWMKAERVRHISVGTRFPQKGKRQASAEPAGATISSQVTTCVPLRAMQICRYTHVFLIKKQAFSIVFFYSPRVEINGNLGLPIFEPQDAKPNSWKRSRESESHGFQSIKIFFTQNQVSWTNCILLGFQRKTESPRGVQSPEYRLLILRNATGWCLISISETGISRMKQWNVGKVQRIQEFPSSRLSLNTAALFWLK